MILTWAVAIKAPADALPGIVALAGDGGRGGLRERTLDSFLYWRALPFRIIIEIYPLINIILRCDVNHLVVVNHLIVNMTASHRRELMFENVKLVIVYNVIMSTCQWAACVLNEHACAGAGGWGEDASCLR